MTLQELLETDRHVSHAELAEALGIASGTLRNYLFPHRGMLLRTTGYRHGSKRINRRQVKAIIKVLGYE